MTPIAEIRDALAAATTGPWSICGNAIWADSASGFVVDATDDGKAYGLHSAVLVLEATDQALIASSPTWLAELCDRVERAERLLDNDWAYNAIQDGIAGLPPEVGCNGGSRSVACLRAAYEREKCRAESAEAKLAEVERSRDEWMRFCGKAEADRDAAITERDAESADATLGKFTRSWVATHGDWRLFDAIDKHISAHAKASGGEHG